ncbi:RNA interference and silencing protein [Blastomyces gilchristii SLH14081]|uniref:RNA interference and silencing protein n=1 Tax=Blastomyces gilchristii (strain SLH14081) TaxID=559298 RepID=A0A179UC30_BLAGS|nr:RNA interference and silencing protein [Blastomyces gilchristii SLH14081]OAT04571.1 RNA interference and silencing protein [Blastomyces gilchristii SLH14081]
MANPQDQDPKVMKVEDALHPMTKKTFDLGSLKLIKGFPSCPGSAQRPLAGSVPGSCSCCSSQRNWHQGNLATDFRSTLVFKTKFSSDETIIEVHYCSEDEDEPAARATTYKVRVLYMKSLSISELTNYLNFTDLGQSFVGKQELMQALNIFLNHYAKSADNLATIGLTKSFSLHQNAARGDLSSGLKVIQGFFLSVRIATCHILVNINISHGAFYHTGPLPALMSSYSVWNTVALEKFLKLVQVQTTHLPEKRNRANEIIPRVKTIFGLARMDDGLGMAHPPCVRQHGAGAKDVEFWLDGEASSPGALKAEAKGQGQRDG